MLEKTFMDFFQPSMPQALLIAYSGGLDSHVLLHLASRLRLQYPTIAVRAIHINHQLQCWSSTWVNHCQQQCAALKIPLQVVVLNLDTHQASLEAVARQGRYAAFAASLQPHEALLTAHHQDDQAETLLLNLLRGAGTAGLAAMPAERAFAQGRLLRPLLTCSRSELEQYAAAQQLSYIQDPSNNDTDFNRNFLRHTLMPILESRWPATKTVLARAAEHQAEQQALSEYLLQMPWQQVQGSYPQTLSVQALKAQPIMLQKALLRYWLKQLGFLAPEEKKLKHILSDVVRAREDANPCVAWQGCEIRRYRDNLYALSSLSPAPTQVVDWDGLHPLKWGGYRIPPAIVKPWLAQASAAMQLFEIRPRVGGERLQRGKQSVDLKTYWQTKGVTPWERERIPLIWLNNKLIIVPDIELIR